MYATKLFKGLWKFHDLVSSQKTEMIEIEWLI